MASPFRREVSPTAVAVAIVVVVALIVAVYWFTFGRGPKTEPWPRPPEGVGAPPGTVGQPAMPPR